MLKMSLFSPKTPLFWTPFGGVPGGGGSLDTQIWGVPIWGPGPTRGSRDPGIPGSHPPLSLRPYKGYCRERRCMTLFRLLRLRVQMPTLALH